MTKGPLLEARFWPVEKVQPGRPAIYLCNCGFEQVIITDSYFQFIRVPHPCQVAA